MNIATAPVGESEAAQHRADHAFLGHPKGLAVLSAAEACERFSYYGMQALLVLYASKQLFQPGHIERIWGFGPVRAFFASVYGAATPEALAGSVAGLYAGLVYLTPLAGGLIADRFLGRTRTILLGAVVMALGHFLMAFDHSFLIAIACLLVGTGCFKGNISAQVGDLYAEGDLRRADAYQLFMLCFQVSVMLAPLVCGTLGEKVAWHWGFGAAGIVMLASLLIYTGGRRWLHAERAPTRTKSAEPRPALRPGEGRRVLLLVALVPVIALSFVGNQEIFVGYELWGDAHYALTFFGWSMPVSYLISVDAFVSTFTMAASLAFWRWWATRRKEPDEITKLTIGTLFSAAAPLALAIGSAQAAATGGKVSLGWGLAFHLLNDIGFSNAYPVGLALYSRVSPKALSGTMIAVFYLSLFLCGLIVAKLATLVGTVSGFTFWGLHAILIAGAALVFLLVRSAAGRLFAATVDPEAIAA